ncbi:MAG TPA: terminase family protein, partial [bacterium]
RISFDQHQVDELQKCAADVYYFLEHYYKVFDLDREEVPYIPRDYQRRLIDALLGKRFVIAKMPRQYGKSITLIGFLMWKILFNKNQRIAILADKEDTAIKLINDFKFSYERIPLWMQQGPTKWDYKMVKFENGCMVRAAATTKGAMRGSSFNMVILDEFAHVENNIAEEFYTSVYPTISAGDSSQIFIISTPLGMNYFHQMWVDATKGGSDFVPIEVDWSEWPGRDQAWKEQQIRNTSVEKFEQEFGCQFIGSAATLISAQCLRYLTDTSLPPIEKKHSLKIWESPLVGHSYCIAVDVSEGVGLDYSAFSVIDITDFPYRLVATYHDKYIHTMFYPEVIYNTAEAYNKANILVEVNAVGGKVASSLFLDYEYENMLGTVIRNQRHGQELVSAGLATAKSRLGVEMTKSVKKIGCQYMKHLIEDKKLIIWDLETIAELSTFIRKNDKFQAEEGLHDDLVAPLIIFSWACKQDVFMDVCDIDVRKRLLAEHEKQLESEVLPFPKLWQG